MKINQPISSYRTDYETIKLFFDKYASENNFVNNRKRENVIIKHAFFTAVKQLTNLSLASIGSLLNKDHATVLHAYKKHEDNMIYLPGYKQVYGNIYNSLYLNLEIYSDVKEANSISEIKELRFRIINISQKLRSKLVEIYNLKEKNEFLVKHSKAVHARNVILEKELARVKNLL
jgi:hypothetical protein